MPLDEHTQGVSRLLTDCILSVAVVGKGEDFILVRLGDEGDPQRPTGQPCFYAAMDAAEERGLLYCGVIAHANGKTGARLAPGRSADADNPEVALPMFLAARAFEEMLAEHLQPSPTPEWLEQLYQLPDTRTERA